MSRKRWSTMLIDDTPLHPCEELGELQSDYIDEEAYRRRVLKAYIDRDPATEVAIAKALRARLISNTKIGRKAIEYVDRVIDTFRTSRKRAVSNIYKEFPEWKPVVVMGAGDGIDHINVYSRGRTEIGRMLSNFYRSPFTHPKHGRFESIEGYWYWLSTGMQFDALRQIYGFHAKKVGREYRSKAERGTVRRDPLSFERNIKKAMLCKIEQNPDIARRLKENTLPLEHYYLYGKDEDVVRIPEKTRWVIDYLEALGRYLRGEAHKLVVAGSRNIQNYDWLSEVYFDSGLEAIEIVSGMANGVDKLGIQLAEDLRLPVAEFPADWDKLGKRAGFIRNEEMGHYGTAGLLLWDGQSPGTLNMRNCLQNLRKPFVLATENQSEIVVNEVPENEIYVFGSNDLGVHGAGAAKIARLYHGAIMGQAEGLQGKSYAIPTRKIVSPKGEKTKLKSLTLEEIKPYADRFIQFTKDHPELSFYIAGVGTGLAGNNPEEIIKLLEGAVNCRYPEEWQIYFEQKRDNGLYPILVGKKWDPGAVYVGRPHPLGNPYPLYDNNRNEVCDRYDAWLRKRIKENDGDVLEALRTLQEHARNRPLILGCYCAPKRCHADSIKRVLETHTF